VAADPKLLQNQVGLHLVVFKAGQRTVPDFQSCEGMPGSVVSYSKFCDVTFHRHQRADKEGRMV
jgi:hypothetical protein